MSKLGSWRDLVEFSRPQYGASSLRHFLMTSARFRKERNALSSEARFWLLAMVGLGFEARIAAGPGVLVVCRSDSPDYPMLLQKAAEEGCRCMLSFGVAGGLAPELRPGDCVVASAVMDGSRVYRADDDWTERLTQVVPGSRRGVILGVDAVVQEPSVKRALSERTGAIAVDMESHLVARAAEEQGLAFAVIRVVIDPAERAVPDAALCALTLRGSAYLAALTGELAARPSELTALLRIACDSVAARLALARIRRALGPQFGFLGEEADESRRGRSTQNAPSGLSGVH